ncbi:MAG: Crp/Fnr family transcriptional regulator [Chloroflexota bacterium]|nr:Crp/Fnr family transcriptional regulator [Chloroflexota bacterium]
MLGARRQDVWLLEEDPELGAEVPTDESAAATQQVLAPLRVVEPGSWEADEEYSGQTECFGLLVLEGFLLRHISCLEQSSAELLGPGDVIRPWDHDGDYPLESITTSFVVLERARIAVLGARFLESASQWPTIMGILIQRIGRRSRWLAVRTTISQLERATVRVLYLLWHLAERWGRVTAEGIVVPIELTHKQIAELIGARRPSVTNALGELQKDALVARRAAGGWVLRHDIADQLDALLAR